MSVKMEVWGDYACWSRPELKTERVFIRCADAERARAACIESIYWHPGLR